jgi:PAS domain S-box-containing protein
MWRISRFDWLTKGGTGSRALQMVGPGIASLAVAIFALQVAARLFDLGSAATDWSYLTLIIAGAAAVLVRAALVPRQRLAWGLIGVGLAAWASADAYYFFGQRGSALAYPSLSDGLYLSLYIVFIAGLRLLGGRVRGPRAVSLSLAVAVLGLATLWSWLVFDGVVSSASGDTAAVATTLAYPLLDLLLVGAVLAAVISRGWRDPAMLALGAGFSLMAVGDSIYAVQVANGTYVDGTLIESLWPAAALAIAMAAWLDRSPASRGIGGERTVPLLAAAAVATAAAVQLVDHFARVNELTFVLSGLTLIAGVAQLVLLFRDRTHAQAAVDAAKILRSVSIDAALECIVSIDGEGTVREWNDAARHTFGYRPEYAIGQDLAELIIPPEHRSRHRRGLASLVETGDSAMLNRRFEVMGMHAQGGTFPVELTITRVGVEPPMFTGFLRDISEQRRREEENERLAAIVRSSADAILSKNLQGIITAWNRGAESLYGYTAAEAVGSPLADLIVPANRRGEIEEVTNSVLSGIPAAFETQRVRKDGHVIDVSLRAFPIRNLAGEVVGVSTCAHDITDRKQREELDRRDREGRLWRGRVKAALEEDRFMFWGQPVVDVRTGAIHHHELLLRMDLDGDVVTPNHFLPHAETSDLMAEIDRWAVGEGLAFARDVPVAINLSGRSFGNAAVMREIRAALTSPALARNVIFEITETAAVADIGAAKGLVNELIELGCGVALDDFGTGYGSFTYLEHLHVTELKIDMSFVRALADNPDDQRLVRSLIGVARNFEMKTVAEGVEDAQTANLLRTLGVDFVQGYYIGYPAQMTAAGRWPSATPITVPNGRGPLTSVRP